MPEVAVGSSLLGGRGYSPSMICVLGAGGPTGLECVRKLLKDGTPVRAVVRNVEKYAGRFGSAEVTAGDVTDEASLKSAFEGCNSVVFAASAPSYWAPKEVDYLGVVNTANAAKEVGIDRVVLISSRLVDPSDRFHPIRLLLNNIKYSLMDNKFLGEEALRGSGQEYCIIRPGGLTGGDNQRKAKAAPGTEHIVAAGARGDMGSSSSSIHRTDVAAVVIEALTSPDAMNKTVEIVARPHVEGDPDFEERIKSLFASIPKQ